MERERRYLGKWEFGCLVFHACFYKIFTTYPRQFSVISGTAGWLTALYTGVLFLGILGLSLFLMKRYRSCVPKSLVQVGRGLLAIYWIVSAAYALGEFTRVLQEVAFPQSPQWFLGGILLLGAVVTVLCGGKAVYRMHSLTVLGVGISMALIAVLGIKYAKLVYLTPWLGKGANQVFGTGLSTLFFYTDAVLIFQLASRCRREVSVYKTGFLGAAFAVVLNVVLILVASMSHSSALGEVSSNLIYPLTKAAYFGNFWSRMDAIYLLALMTSGFLYLSMALHLFYLAVKGIGKVSTQGRKAAAVCLAGILCVSLTGCYDSREVEAAAYTVALGIDQGESQDFRYTFQLSNPLELGGSMETSSKEQTGGEEDTKENKTVSNIAIEADNFYLALNHLKSHMSKEPDFSHLKLLVFSTDAAKEGILEHASLLFREQEVRPSTNVCLAESAGEFLKKVKPTLEQSTARYYELFFQNQNTPYAPVVELREFVSRGTDGGWDPVLPVATPEKLSGIGVFRKGKLITTMDEKAAMLYKILSGKAEEITVRAGNSSFAVSSKSPPVFQMRENLLEVKSCLEAKLISGNRGDSTILQKELEKEMTAFLEETIQKKTDVLGVGAWLRGGMLREEEWNNLNWHKELPKLDPISQIQLKNIKNLQK